MKKSQRLRLAALLAKGTNLTAAEQLECAWLSALASGNPDTSKDEDDSPGGFRTALMEAISARKTLGAELATAKARVTELEGQVAAAAATKPTLPEGALAAADVTALRTQLSEANEKLSATTAQLNIFGAALGMKPAELVGKTDADVRTAVETRLGALAIEKIAALGFPQGNLPASAEASKGSGGDEYADLQAQLATEKDPAKAGILAAKANKLRDAKWNASAGKN